MIGKDSFASEYIMKDKTICLNMINNLPMDKDIMFITFGAVPTNMVLDRINWLIELFKNKWNLII